MTDLFEFDEECAQTYTEECECGNKIEVSAQQDNHPEYYTEIHIKCICNRSVKFELPVN
jgi:hypothetical protein